MVAGEEVEWELLWWRRSGHDMTKKWKRSREWAVAREKKKGEEV